MAQYSAFDWKIDNSEGTFFSQTFKVRESEVLSELMYV
jgi:hypothetical protein